MTTKPPRRVPKEEAATTAEIIAAIEALTPAQLGKLKRYAQNRMWRLRRIADGKKGDDLFQIAVDELMNGTRRWVKDNVDMAAFLAGAMRSKTAIPETDLVKKNAEGDLYSPMDALSGGGADPEERMIAEEKRRDDRQLIQKIEHIFKDDPDAQMLMAGAEEGYDPAGIRELWGWTQTQYNTNIRRMRRTLDREAITFNGAGGKDNVQ